MGTSVEQLEELLQADSEDEHLEFKEAKTDFKFERLAEYCAALANEGGGRIVLGVTDKRPRQAVGTRAFSNLAKPKKRLWDVFHFRIDAEEILHPRGRVVVFHVPSRPVGFPIEYRGTYLMRVGDSLAPMPPDHLRRIFDETVPDFSAQVSPDADLSCLSPGAIERFHELWIRKSGNERLRQLSEEQLLTDAELVVDSQLTHAALILLATRASLGRHNLGQAEIIFEYRGMKRPPDMTTARTTGRASSFTTIASGTESTCATRYTSTRRASFGGISARSTNVWCARRCSMRLAIAIINRQALYSFDNIPTS